jgi:4-amino-4-deoxychorismate lyase
MKLLETLAFRDGKVLNLSYHQQRAERSIHNIFGKDEASIDLSTIEVPTFAQKGWYRCRVIYSQNIEEIGWFGYAFKEIKRLKVVEIPSEFDYQYKWADRSFFQKILQQNSDFEEVILTKNGQVTDATIGNLAFWDGQAWHTSDTPLLAGTKRQQLLEKGLLLSCPIHLDDLKSFENVAIINAFRDLDFTNYISIKNIVL